MIHNVGNIDHFSRIVVGLALLSMPMCITNKGAKKALYLSWDHWLRHGHLKAATIEFRNAGGVLFGVKDYIPGRAAAGRHGGMRAESILAMRRAVILKIAAPKRWGKWQAGRRVKVNAQVRACSEKVDRLYRINLSKFQQDQRECLLTDRRVW
jgi:hypothetical protein